MINPKGGYWGMLTITKRFLQFQSLKDKPNDRSELLIGCIPEMLDLTINKKKRW